MAAQQPYQAYTQNKGTLVPGQSISVNKYTVEVERYLSQGGFAHVYLVRTAVPVYNTTHHVLKRIAVASDSMLTEVKKEVDIMRILKGHPNIVHLIDAAWNKLPNDQYEVFILMEFCKGGGIIDMMNRRLRERLTEAEILQIFVDVCEGVAAMHNMRPALLHRDLKVENILQSSPTSFKLCDFGSATTVAPRPPASTQEIRALEADLNRHTTLQYRAPEMVDPYLRRPVDEKSDVWALGVLLYKLCYYTTPFEEHGPLAILNVQYRTPPYPVYSVQMNTLIGSMLREHGAQRPSVFELLNLVHRLRGTKSSFTYNIPVPPPLAPRPIPTHTQLQAQQNKLQPQSQPLLHNTSAPSLTSSSTPPVNAGVQAREKVLEAIAPMRRGRPTNVSKDFGTSSRPSSPQQLPKSNNKPAEKTGNWMDDGFAAEEEKAWKAATSVKSMADGLVKKEDAWAIKASNAKPGTSASAQGFGDDFAEKLWDTFDPSKETSKNGVPIPPKATPNLPARPPALTSGDSSRNTAKNTTTAPFSGSKFKTKEAFGDLGLGLSTQPAPTLGEARKLRTGMASLGSTTTNTVNPRVSPAPSPRPTYQTPAQTSRTTPPIPSGSSWRHTLQPTSVSSFSLKSPPSPLTSPDGLPAESRFPSLEELDASFGTPSPEPTPGTKQLAPSYTSGQASLQPPAVPPKILSGGITGGLTGGTRPSQSRQPTTDGVRSQQVTGIAMRDHNVNKRGASPSSVTALTPKPLGAPLVPRPTLIRKHRSSVAIKQASSPTEETFSNSMVGNANSSSGSVEPRPPPRDWLTGDDDEKQTNAPKRPTTPPRNSTPVMRGSPSKRGSFTEQSSATLQTAQQAIPARQGDYLMYSSPFKPASPSKSRTSTPTAHTQKPARDVSINTMVVAQSTTSQKENWSAVAVISKERKDKELDSSSSADEGPEDAGGYAPKTGRSSPSKGKDRHNSINDLVDLWGGPSPLDSTPKTSKARSPPALAQPAQRSSSPQRMTDEWPRSRSPIRSHQKQPSSSGSALSPTSAGGKSRPQSMFVFPVAKAQSGGAPLSAGLPSPSLPTPIEDSRLRQRRTSISDMVQRYEAIGGVKTKPGVPATTKPHATSPILDNSKISLSPSTSRTFNGSRTTPTNPPEMLVGDYKKVPISAVGLPGLSSRGTPPSKPVVSRTTGPSSQNAQPIGLPGMASTARSNATGLPRSSPVDSPYSGREKEAESNTLPYRVRKVSTPAGKPIFPSNGADTFPIRKGTEGSSKPEEGQSSSPDRPYQGVGKLIDQWQRKTAETETSAPVVRRGGIGGRGGLAGGRGW